MPTSAQIERNTIVRIAAYDNDEYKVSDMEKDHSLKIYDDLGLGSERRKRCAKSLNKYIQENGGTKVKVDDLVKKSDTIADVIGKVEKAFLPKS